MVSFFRQNKALAFLGLGIVGLGLIVLAYIIFVFIPNSLNEEFTFVDYPAPQIGVAVDSKGMVADVLPGSPAEIVGIARGDILKQVGAATLTSGGDLQEAFRQEIYAKTTPIIDKHVSGNFTVDTLPVVVSRNGQTLSFVVRPASPPFTRPAGNQISITATAVPASSDWIYL